VFHPKVQSELCLMSVQVSPSQLLMPGRDDKLPSRPRVGQATVAKTSASAQATKEQRCMVDAIAYICAMSRGEPNEHLLLSSRPTKQVRTRSRGAGIHQRQPRHMRTGCY
jgi:hypothetical protein